MKLVIVGGVAGGASAAARTRRLSESAEIVMSERGPVVSFANCGLPYYVGGEIRERGKLVVTRPEILRRRYRIDARTETEVVAVDRAAKSVVFRDLRDGSEGREAYDALILAPGAAPWVPRSRGRGCLPCTRSGTSRTSTGSRGPWTPVPAGPSWSARASSAWTSSRTSCAGACASTSSS